MYLALKIMTTFNEGGSISILGLYSTPEKALEAFKDTSWWSEAEKRNDGRYSVYLGDFSVAWEIVPVTIDEPLEGY